MAGLAVFNRSPQSAASTATWKDLCYSETIIGHKCISGKELRG